MHFIKRHSFLFIALLIIIGLYLFLRSDRAVAPTEPNGEINAGSEEQGTVDEAS